MLSDKEVDFFLKKLEAVTTKVELESWKPKNNFELLDPEEIYTYLDRFVVGQDYAKKVLSVAAHNHYKRLLILKESNFTTRLDKSNVMLIGPTGSGKTFLVRKLAEALNVPCYVADANSLTQAGYVGKDVDSIIEGLVSVCNGNYDAAATGIIFIDEIDKICKKGSSNTRSSKDVGGEGVQQALLKLIEGTKVELETNSGLSKLKLEIDTSNILVIVGGAFVGLEDVVASRLGITKATGIGINADISKTETDLSLIHKAIPQDIEDFGFIPEFVGRLPLLATLNELTTKDLVRILTKIENNQVSQYKDLFKYSSKRLSFDSDAVVQIAELTKEQKTGARGLKCIIEKVLMEKMFKLQSTRVTVKDVNNVRSQLFPDT